MYTKAQLQTACSACLHYSTCAQGGWQQGGWPTQTFWQSSMGDKQAPETPCPPSIVYWPANPVYLIQLQNTLCDWAVWRGSLPKKTVTFPAIPRNWAEWSWRPWWWHVSPRPTQHGPYSHNSAQTVALTVCTSCTYMCFHWFKSMR